MSISVKRDLKAPVSEDKAGNIRIVFQLCVDEELNAKQSLQRLNDVADFLDTFEAKFEDKIDGAIYAVRMTDTEDEDMKAHIENIERIKIRAGVAQQFQTEFNAEFN